MEAQPGELSLEVVGQFPANVRWSLGSPEQVQERLLILTRFEESVR
jgi:hypothetical protein